VYSFHFEEYSPAQKGQIILRYLNLYQIDTRTDIIEQIAYRVQSVPREIHNFCIKIRDFLIAHPMKTSKNGEKLMLSDAQRNLFQERINIDEEGLSPLHYQYLKILEECEGPVGLRTLALKLGIDEISVEEDIERVLIKR
jgi:Holliday junction resolvasome RuvABC ATP-dependent DNA helicase subunit